MSRRTLTRAAAATAISVAIALGLVAYAAPWLWHEPPAADVTR